MGKSDSWSKTLASVSERLLLVAQSQIQREIRENSEIILREQRPKGVINGIGSVAVALRIAAHIRDVADVCLALAGCDSQAARFICKGPQKAWPSEFLSITTIVRVDHVSPKSQLVTSLGNRQRIAELVLTILQLRGLRRSAHEIA